MNTTFRPAGPPAGVTAPRGLYDDTEDDRVGMEWDDATWILTSSFIIFTMQSGQSAFLSNLIQFDLLIRTPLLMTLFY